MKQDKLYSFTSTKTDAVSFTSMFTTSTLVSDEQLTLCSKPFIRDNGTKRLIISFCDKGKISVTIMTMCDENPVKTENVVLSMEADAGVVPTCFDADLLFTDSLYISCKNTPQSPSINWIKEELYQESTYGTELGNQSLQQSVQNTISIYRYDLTAKTFDTPEKVIDTNSHLPGTTALNIKTLFSATKPFLVVYQKDSPYLMFFSIDLDSQKIVTNSKFDVDLTDAKVNGTNVMFVYQFQSNAQKITPTVFMYTQEKTTNNFLVAKVIFEFDGTTITGCTLSKMPAGLYKDLSATPFMAVGQPFITAPIVFGFIANQKDSKTVALGSFMANNGIDNASSDMKDFQVPMIAQDPSLTFGSSGFSKYHFWTEIISTASARHVVGLYTINL